MNNIPHVLAVTAVLLCAAIATAEPDLDAKPDGSLDRSGALLPEDGRMVEPLKVWTAVDGCIRKANIEKDAALAYCGCVVDWMRLQSQRAMQRFLRFAKDPSTGTMDVSGINACGKWVTDGFKGKQPFTQKGMMPSAKVAVVYDRCATGRDNREGWIYCNKLVAGVAASEAIERAPDGSK